MYSRRSILVVATWRSAVFVSVGLIISVLGAYLAWSLICAEVLFAAAKTEDMPKIFSTENANKVPAAALWLTNIVIQLFVISTYFSQDAFHLMLSLTSSMTLIPYLFVAAYGFKVSRDGAAYAAEPEGRQSDLIMAVVAVVYTIFMIYAGGMKFILLSAVLYAPGTVLYILARRERDKTVFQTIDWVVFGVAVVGALVGVYGLVSGTITI